MIIAVPSLAVLFFMLLMIGGAFWLLFVSTKTDRSISFQCRMRSLRDHAVDEIINETSGVDSSSWQASVAEEALNRAAELEFPYAVPYAASILDGPHDLRSDIIRVVIGQRIITSSPIGLLFFMAVAGFVAARSNPIAVSPRSARRTHLFLGELLSGITALLHFKTTPAISGAY